jgi:enamine deaminase RidA (YjgF/YER057c/UK114 family)
VIDKKAVGWDTKYFPGNKEASGSASAGNLLFLSGCDGVNPGTGKMETDRIERQIMIAWTRSKRQWKGLGVQWREW